MNKAVAVALAVLLQLGVTAAQAAETIHAAGSSAAAPIYRAWARAYEKSSGIALEYDAAGSSAGLAKIRGGQAGFGASDIAPAEAELARDGLVLFPVAITGVVPMVHLPRVADGQLRLTGEVLARIFLGEITRWNAPEIRQLNPSLALPDLPIKPVGRTEGSGTTFNFSDYLSRVSPAWKERFGAKPAIAWPAGVAAAKGSDGVVAAVSATPGAIGYADFGYLAGSGLAGVQLRNAEGEFVRAGALSFQGALANSEWASKAAFTTSLVDRAGKTSWPITMGTYALVPRESARPDDTRRALQFILWSFRNGDALVGQAQFVRLPDRVQAAAFKVITGVRDKAGQPIGLAL